MIDCQFDQNSKMLHGYANGPATTVCRPCAKSPQRVAFLTLSTKMQEQSSLLAGRCCLLGVLSRAGVPVNRHALVNLSRFELLYQIFEDAPT